MLEEKLVKRKVSLKALDYGKVEEAAGGTVRQAVTLKAGISDDKARDINKFIKDLGLKGVQSQTQGDQLRVTGKKRDDLQAVIAALQGRRLRHPAAVRELPGLADVPQRSARLPGAEAGHPVLGGRVGAEQVGELHLAAASAG